jgi:hypothetical protein
MKKDVEIIPEETYTGNGTLSCMYDGRLLKMTGTKAEYWGIEQFLAVSVSDSLVPIPERISIVLINFTPNTVMLLDKNSSIPVIGAELNNGENFYRSIAGTVEIKRFDTLQKIVSGTFNCDMVKYGYNAFGEIIPLVGDTITIRSGRFDAPLTLH